MNRGILLFLAVVAGFTAVGYALAEVWDKNTSLEVLGPEDHRVGDFTFTDQQKKVFHSTDHEGKIWIVNSFFSSCPIVCPKVMRNIQNVHNLLRNDEDIVTISFTVDPKRDTPDRLLEYARKYNASHDSWFLLTGEKKELYRHARRSFLLAASDGTGNDEDFIHSENIVIVDPDRKIRALINGTAQGADREVMDAVRKLRKEFKL